MATQVPAGAVEVTLEKLLRSAAFKGSGGLRRFLEYVVRRTLAGEEDSIKEYTIGVEVFDRGISFDPSCDSIVRVEASAGQVDAAQAILHELKKIALTRRVPSSGLAAIYLALGRISLAAAELIRGQHEGDWYLGWARIDPRWKPFRGKLLGF